MEYSPTLTLVSLPAIGFFTAVSLCLIHGSYKFTVTFGSSGCSLFEFYDSASAQKKLETRKEDYMDIYHATQEKLELLRSRD